MSWIGAALTGAGTLLNYNQGNKALSTSMENASYNAEQQREFAMKGIRWRVADAQAAGIHPLYALGANLPTYSPSPISVGANTALGDGLSSMGQDIGRAVDAQRTADERFSARMNELALERGELENQLLRSQIGRLNVTSNPPMQPSYKPSHSNHLIDGQASSHMPSAVGMGGSGGSSADPYVVEPVPIPATGPGGQSQAAGAVPEITWMRTDTGYQAVPNREALEDADIGNPSALMWYFRNNVLPTLAISGNPPPLDYLPEGYDTWVFDPFRQEWQPGHSDSWDSFNPISEWFK